MSTLSPAAGPSAPLYFPGSARDWETAPPAAHGVDAGRLAAAVALATACEAKQTEGDIETMTRLGCAGEAHTEIIGPMRERGGQAGMLIRHGRILAEWGDTARVDMAFSITKSFISTVGGIAWQRGLLPDLDRAVAEDVDDALFAAGANRAITWNHLLRQTSGWEGVLWDKPAWAVNRERVAARLIRAADEPPGSRFEYNDVRVNLLAHCLLQVLRRPLPEILRQAVMDPIGASRAWQWHGYRNSWITIDGIRMQSVSGGGHWGGGMWISTRDLALWAYLILREGQWRGREVIARDWLAQAMTPGPVNPNYGFLNWNLNTGRAKLPAAPESAVYTTGSTIGDGGCAAQNVVYLDRANDLVIALRWIQGERLGDIVAAFLAALEGQG